jgi:SAM-dependent methyltransferase
VRRGLAALAAAVLLQPARALPQEDVPYVQTPDNVTLAMLELARVGPLDYVIDLGSGDGRIVVLAAKRFGARGLGVEIVPKLVEESRANARRAGVADRAEFREQDLFKTDLAPATVITMYLLPEVNLQLRDPILALKPGTRIVSHDWDMGSWKPDRTVTLAAPDKRIGLEKASRVHYWVVPARVAGAWCAGARRLVIEQEFQNVRVNGHEGRVEGSMVVVAAGLTLEAEASQLRVRSAEGPFAALLSATLDRCVPGATGRSKP